MYHLEKKVLQNSVWDSRGFKQVAVSCLVSKVVPMLRAHAEGSRFAELWHAFEGDSMSSAIWDKKMCSMGSDCRVWSVAYNLLISCTTLHAG